MYAVAHVRGGGECGRHWWQQGRLRAKPTTFSDFIDVADWLAGDADGAPPLVDGRRIVSRGLSAGGLLQGAVYSRAPGRWRAVVAEVPFVDCVTTMLDPAIPLTINEWDEWGDPRDPADFACLRSYSPYDNPPPGRGPTCWSPALCTTRECWCTSRPSGWRGCGRPTPPAAGCCSGSSSGAGAHTGPSGRFGHLRYEAEVQAFILAAMGLAAGSSGDQHRHQAAVPVGLDLRPAAALHADLQHVRAHAAERPEIEPDARRRSGRGAGARAPAYVVTSADAVASEVVAAEVVASANSTTANPVRPSGWLNAACINAGAPAQHIRGRAAHTHSSPPLATHERRCLAG